MTAILIKRHQFTGLSKVYSREPDGLAAILRGLAIDNARLKVEINTVKQITYNSGGTAGSGLVALAIPLVAIDATSAGGAQVSALNTSLGKIANAGKVLTGTINEASALLGLPASSAASGAQAAADTILIRPWSCRHQVPDLRRPLARRACRGAVNGRTQPCQRASPGLFASGTDAK